MGVTINPKIFFLEFPKDAFAPRQQEIILKIQRPHSQEVGWVVFWSFELWILSLFMMLGYKLLIVNGKKKC